MISVTKHGTGNPYTPPPALQPKVYNNRCPHCACEYSFSEDAARHGSSGADGHDLLIECPECSGPNCYTIWYIKRHPESPVHVKKLTFWQKVCVFFHLPIYK